jgi:hypothetical protein
MERSKPFALAVPVSHTDHVLGPWSARVTLVEYGDFTVDQIVRMLGG